MGDPIGEWKVDVIKENLSHYFEAQVDHAPLSCHEKEEQRRQMKQNIEVYIQGVKDEMKATGNVR